MSPKHILYPALKLILVNRLQKALYCSKTVQQAVESTNSDPVSNAISLPIHLHNVSNHSSPNPSEIPVNRVQKDSQVWYVSPIALKLTLSNRVQSTGHQQTINLAQEIVDILNRDIVAASTVTDLLPLDRVRQNFVSQSDPAGWIHFKLRAAGLHEWLTILCDRLPTFVLQDCELPIAISPNTFTQQHGQQHDQTDFAVLHTYARCCSLLHLGMQEQVIQLDQLSPELAVWIIKNPDPIAWLNADSQIYCTHPAEQFLIAQIIDILDELGCNTSPFPSKRLWKFSQQLSQAFQQFDAGCRIFGAIQTDDRPLAQARLGLVLITQALLNWILRSWLHLSPPIAL